MWKRDQQAMKLFVVGAGIQLNGSRPSPVREDLQETVQSPLMWQGQHRLLTKSRSWMMQPVLQELRLQSKQKHGYVTSFPTARHVWFRGFDLLTESVKVRWIKAAPTY